MTKLTFQVEKTGLALGSLTDIRERRKLRRANERRRKMGRPEVALQWDKADFASGNLATGGALVAEQGAPRRKRKKGTLSFLTSKQTITEPPHETGPTPTGGLPAGVGLIIPAELQEGAKDLKTKDALEALFAQDLATLSPQLQQFALRELEKAEVGDQLRPEVLQEIARVVKATSILVRTPDLKKAEGDREDVLQIRKTDEELQIVWGEVYIPGLPDSQGDIMTAEEVRKAAYCFMGAQRLDQIDRMHDKDVKGCGSLVVENFIAREGDPLFIEDAWVIGVHIPDKEIWAAVKRGDYNGFSMEGEATRTEKQFELDLPEEIEGTTSSDNEHDHTFTVRFDDQGQFLGGSTSTDKDPTGGPGELHAHGIQKGTITESSGANPHVHRYSISEAILEVSIGRRPPTEAEIGDQGHAT